MAHTRFDIITAFPESLHSYLNASMVKRARARGLVDVRVHDLRKFTSDRHHTVDDRPYGGGPGMVLRARPIAKAVTSLIGGRRDRKAVKLILLDADGKQFSASIARQYAKRFHRIILIAGHYEGVDRRLPRMFALERVSIGPYILTGGELPALIVTDAVIRHIPGVLGKAASLEERRLGTGVPAYTRPEALRWRGKVYRVPKVLLSGDHRAIDTWRRRHAK